ncbi:hypothetical protein ACQ4PT_047201 [Festuca glaucescens]
MQMDTHEQVTTMDSSVGREIAQVNRKVGKVAVKPIIQFPEEDETQAGEQNCHIQVTMTKDMLAKLQQAHDQARQQTHISQASQSRGPRPSDMIPALQGLSSLQVSFGSVNDITMQPADSVLGKRAADDQEAQCEQLDLSLGLVHGQKTKGGTPKKGRTQAQGKEQSGQDQKGQFSVKSAYAMGMEHKEREMNMQATSARPEGINKEWELIWKSSAPPKVKTFTWKLARNGLPTQQNFRKRKMDNLGICTICGTEEEDMFHALITCPPARNLWNQMRECWDLPNEKILENTGRDWVLPLLVKLNNIQRLMVMMVLWRVWHVHNELTHNKPAPPIEASKRFLCSYVDTLLFLKQHPHADPCKGKQVVSYSGRYLKEPVKQKKVEVKQWVRPPRGRLKLNVDGSYVMQTGEGGVGMILRDEGGAVIFAAWRYMPVCTSAMEAELAACDEGMRLALCWANKPFELEMDCLNAVSWILEPEQSGSTLVHLVRSVQEAVAERNVDVRHIDGSQNAASHILAKLGRESKRTQLWLNSLPEEVEKTILMDCNVTLS